MRASGQRIAYDRRMGRALGTIALAILCAGCTHAYSRRLVVSAPAAEASAQAPAPLPGDMLPGDIVPSDDPRLAPAPTSAAPALTARSCAWRTYDPGEVLTEVEKTAHLKQWCLARARHKSNLVAGALVGASIAYGFAFFEFGSSGWSWKDDGWFGENSNAGGADKLGHAVTAHIETCALAAIYRGWGIPRKEAALRGALAAWAGQLAIEIGDGFSADFGFSWSDIAANTAGALFGYAHAANPGFARIFDFRWEYWPSENFGDEDLKGEDGGGDITTDYEGSTYVLAANLGAIYSRRSNVLDFVDFQLAWRSRGYVDPSVEKQRTVLIGVGLNLQTVCDRLGLRGIGKVFQYYQPPGTALRFHIDLD